MATTSNNIPQGYKATALGIIPQEWEVTRLEDLCHNQGDYGINAPATDFSNELPTYLRITDIDDDGKFIIANKASVNNPNSRSYHLKDGDIVFARTGATVGKTYLYNREDGDLVFAGFLIRFSPNAQKIVPYYLKAYTNTSTYWKWVKITSQRSGQPGINATEYCSLQIPVPPLAEQRKIAEVLGVWDEAIEKQARLIEKLALFSEPWKKVKLGEIGKFDKGYGVPKESIRNTGNKAITYGEIYTKHDFVIKKFTSYIDDETAVVSKKITQGAILFTGSGETLEDIGKCVAFIDNDIAYAGGDIIIFNPSIEINSLVLSYCLNSAPVNAQKATYGQGHSVVHIYQKDLAKLQVTIPSFPEQNAIAEVLTAADREIELAKEKLERLRSQKRGLMQQLLTGKKRVNY